MPLRVTVELIPRGDEARKSVVGSLEIENTADHPDHPRKANYKYRMVGPINGGELGLWHQGVIADVDRERLIHGRESLFHHRESFFAD